MGGDYHVCVVHDESGISSVVMFGFVWGVLALKLPPDWSIAALLIREFDL